MFPHVAAVIETLPTHRTDVADRLQVDGVDVCLEVRNLGKLPRALAALVGTGFAMLEAHVATDLQISCTNTTVATLEQMKEG